MRLPIPRLLYPPHQPLRKACLSTIAPITTCRTTAQQCLPSIRFITTTTPTSQEAGENKMERLRRRIWGDNAPTVTGPQVRPVEEDLTKADGYRACHDGRGLPVVGYVGKLGVRKMQDIVPLESFPTLNKVTDPELLTAYLRKAVVETYTNVLHGKEADAGLARDVTVVEDLTRQVEVVQNDDGGFKFLYKSEDVLNGLLEQQLPPPPQQQQEASPIVEGVEEPEAISADATPSSEPTAQPGEAPIAEETAITEETTIAAADPIDSESVPVIHEIIPPPSSITPLNLAPTDAWLSLPLPQTHIFAIHKRILAYTGLRLSDHSLNHSPAVSHLLQALHTVSAPPAEKLDLLATAPELADLGNVRVLKSRLRPVDKEVEKGRVSPATKEWLENKRRKEAGEQVEGEWRYKWDEGKYFAL